MGLGRRIRRLETFADRGECPGCGLAPGTPFVPDEVFWHDEEGDDPRPEFCTLCGRQLVYVVGWRDIGPEDPGEGAS